MKQHMLTHKIRDMPPRLFEAGGKPSLSAPPKQTAGSPGPTSSSGSTSGRPGSPSPLLEKQDDARSLSPRVSAPLPLALSMTMPADVLKEAQAQAQAGKRSPPEGGAIPPVPKRQPSKYTPVSLALELCAAAVRGLLVDLQGFGCPTRGREEL